MKAQIVVDGTWTCYSEAVLGVRLNHPAKDKRIMLAGRQYCSGHAPPGAEEGR